jgi:hypothetical protein
MLLAGFYVGLINSVVEPRAEHPPFLAPKRADWVLPIDGRAEQREGRDLQE